MQLRGYALTAFALILTVYGQLVFKWRVDAAGDFPDTGRLRFLIGVMLDPWVLSTIAFTFVAALAYAAALTSLPLSRAYPVLALSFVIVVVASAPFFGEGLTPLKIFGVSLITVGVFVATRG
ncbi:MAG: hypothetical protein H0V25_10265 [Solirubrobacterales bacterium]|nr:hypothetical protein [Solirubrobacterales bacterium]